MSLRSFAPVAEKGARVLILGSMPGGESLRRRQYYAYPRNVFWRMMGTLFDFSADLPYEDRLTCLKRNHVALWDSLAGCERTGSLDSNIRNPEPNDIAGLLDRYPTIRTIFCNGEAAFRFLKRYHAGLWKRTDLEMVRLPSTSPAAAAYSFEEKLNRWRMVREKAGPAGPMERKHASADFQREKT